MESRGEGGTKENEGNGSVIDEKTAKRGETERRKDRTKERKKYGQVDKRNERNERAAGHSRTAAHGGRTTE
jgi:hypothetical protein